MCLLNRLPGVLILYMEIGRAKFSDGGGNAFLFFSSNDMIFLSPTSPITALPKYKFPKFGHQ